MSLLDIKKKISHIYCIRALLVPIYILVHRKIIFIFNVKKSLFGKLLKIFSMLISYHSIYFLIYTFLKDNMYLNLIPILMHNIVKTVLHFKLGIYKL